MSTNKQSLYNNVHDPLYDVLSKELAIDIDTQHKVSKKITASANGTGSVGSGKLNGKRTEFNFSNQGMDKMRHDTSRLNVGLVFGDSAGTATATNCSPSWNLFGKLIKEITLTLNTTPVYSKTNGQYKACFTSRLLKHYSIEQLEKLGFLFTPIQGDRKYLRKYADSGVYDTSATILQADDDGYCKFAAVDSDAASVATSSTAFWNVGVNKAGAAELRQEKYIGSASHNMTHVLSIPFADLFPRCTGIPKNVRSVGISIEWTSDTEILEYSSASSAGHVHIVKCDIDLDQYKLSTGQNMEALQEKMANESDHIAFYDTDVFTTDWTGNDIQRQSIKNLDSVMVMQFTDEVKNFNSTSGSYYQSCGQLALCNLEGDSATDFRSNSYEVDSSVSVNPSNIQIQYNDIVYPITPISLINSSHFDPSGIYYEYLKAFGKVGDRVTGPPMSYELFRETMPFIWLKPFSNNAIKLSGVGDLTIRMSQGSASVTSAIKTGRIHIISHILKVFNISSDSVVSQPTL